VDTLGLIIAAASATDNALGTDLLDKIVEHTSTVVSAQGIPIMPRTRMARPLPLASPTG
jgi:hypothetical protein